MLQNLRCTAWTSYPRTYPHHAPAQLIMAPEFLHYTLPLWATPQLQFLKRGQMTITSPHGWGARVSLWCMKGTQKWWGGENLKHVKMGITALFLEVMMVPHRTLSPDEITTMVTGGLTCTRGHETRWVSSHLFSLWKLILPVPPET